MPSTEIVMQGWLTKSPPSRGIFRPRWRKRWFVLRSGLYPNQFVLEYYTDESLKRVKGTINLDECEQLVGPLSVQERHKYTFQIKTPIRTYFLAAENEIEMSKWVASLCHVCSLKVVEDEVDGGGGVGGGGVVYVRTGDENTNPREQGTEEQGQNNHNSESDSSSPTLSNKIQDKQSGPYIPISECFTGKPITISEPSGEAAYCNVFQFPPKVNWATHPSRTGGGGRGGNGGQEEQGRITQISKTAVHAPPRPPKPKKNGSPALSSEGQMTTYLRSPSTPYENEEGLDSSSTCSSLHSPPSSAGVVYCNISSDTDCKTPKSGHIQPTPPPIVDRNLKPLRRDGSTPSPSPYPSGTMTLPVRKPDYPLYKAGPKIDRTRKPSDSSSSSGHLSLGPTPAQIRSHQHQHQSSHPHPHQHGTLPSSSPHRRAGPIISPNDKRPFPTGIYDNENEMKGTYLQIECPKTKDVSHSPKFSLTQNPSKSTFNHSSKKLSSSSSSNLDNNSTVEYRLIDPIKTQALNRTIEDREKELRKKERSHH